jgi:hypothetical protein
MVHVFEEGTAAEVCAVLTLSAQAGQDHSKHPESTMNTWLFHSSIFI